MELDKDFASFWDVKSLYDYLYFCCPACESKCHIKQEFVDHALSEHPASKAYFQKIGDGSVDDITISESFDFFEDFAKDDFDTLRDEDNDEEPVQKVTLERKVSSVKLTPVTKAPVKDPIKVESKLDCTACDFKAETKTKLKLHNDLTHYKCQEYPKCEDIFALKSKLDSHVKNSHKNERNLHIKKSNNKISRKLVQDKPVIVPKPSKPKSKLTPQEQLDELIKRYGSVSKDGKVTITTTKEGYQELQDELKRIQALIEKEKLKEEEFANEVEIKEELVPIEDVEETPDEFSDGMNCDTVENESTMKEECAEDLDEEKPLSEVKKKVRKSKTKVSKKKVTIKRTPPTPAIPQLCTLCGEKFPSEKRLKHHEFFKHGIEDSSLSQKLKNIQIQCKNCLESFEKTVDLNEHILTCERDLPKSRIHCKHCELFWATTHVLVIHLKVDHGILNAVACEICGKCLTSKSQLPSHIKIVHEKVIHYSCDRCAAGFAHESGLKQHIQAVHEKDSASFLCSFCGKKFLNQSSKDDHENSVHTKANKFYCDRCDFFSFTNYRVKKHKRHVHERENAKKWFCPHCDFKTLNNTRLKEHINAIHTKENKIFCDYCDFFTFKKDCLNQHVASKHFGQKFSCSCCEASYKHKQHLVKHFKEKHSNILPDNIPFTCSYQCNQCDSKFQTKAEVRIHIKEIHKTAQENLL